MRTSTTRTLAAHVGSLPRPAILTELLRRQERGEAIDEAEFARQAETAIAGVVRKQLEVGIGNDGEQPRVAFHTYAARRHRVCRLCRHVARPQQTPQAIAEVEYTNVREAEQECSLFLRCTAAWPQQFTESFMTAAAPGSIATASADDSDHPP